MTWIPEMRSAIADFLANNSELYPNFQVELWGGVVVDYDSVQIIHDQYPFIIVTNFAILLIIIGVSFKSLLIPIRSIFTIGLSAGWAYGICVIHFQYILDEPIYWLCPLFSFSIIVGLGLDYDIFLISKIYEYVQQGFCTKDAITKGVYRTGNVITGAGAIMAISFGGYIFSEVTLLNQIGTVIVSSILLDTFLVRTAMVPAILQLCGDWNWWPGLRAKEMMDHNLDTEFSLQAKNDLQKQQEEADFFVRELAGVLEGKLTVDQLQHDAPDEERSISNNNSFNESHT
eukprot:TRINITY_DN32116_c0_g1_i5.p1 TRINITY_DN32116_c0_g1~~TRINITY_DN32116_c0_g1_i5.p1  ORF type:complete len:287 (+),score=60.98 TRINITY_DN32116_c0_g1_i5:1032-1892(+)